MQTTVASSQFSWNSADFIKGLVMAVLGAVLGFIQGIIESGHFVFDWPAIWHLAVGAAIAYLIKNFFTSSAIVVKDAPQTQVDAIKQGDAEIKVVPK